MKKRVFKKVREVCKMKKVFSLILCFVVLSVSLTPNIICAQSNVCLEGMPIIAHDKYEGNLGDSTVFNLNGNGLTCRDDGKQGNAYGNIGLNGEVFRNGFEVWIARWNFGDDISWASATFDIGGNFTKLSGKTSLIKSYNTNNFDTTVYFYSDDRLLASYRLTPDDYEKNIDVDVKGVKTLKLLVKDNVKTAGGTSFALYDMFLDNSKHTMTGTGLQNTLVYNGHRYQRFDLSMSWEESQQYCETIGGHLVTINSEEEQKNIEDLVSKGNKYQYWLGGKKINNSWSWITNESWQYENWCPAQPDGYEKDSIYLQLINTVDNKAVASCVRFSWNDITNENCSDKPWYFNIEQVGFICEWETTENVGAVRVTVDNKEVLFDQPPVIVNDRTLVPLRAIFEELGATVEWDAATRTATGHGKQNYDVVVTENSNTAYIDGFPYTLDVPVTNYNGRLLAPARFVAEAFGGVVAWDESQRMVRIESLYTEWCDNRSYDEKAVYLTCYDAAMTHGRLMYIANGYKVVILRHGYIDKIGNGYRFVNADGVEQQRYYFNSANELITDYELAERLDFVYHVNIYDYRSRSNSWSTTLNIEEETLEFKQSYAKAIELLEKGATFLNIGYIGYDVGKTFFDQMVVGTIYPPYRKSAMGGIATDVVKHTTRTTFDGILLSGLVNSVSTFNGYCDTISKTYDNYGYGFITNVEDAEAYITAVAGRVLLVEQAEAFAAYLKETYPNLTIEGVLGDMANDVVTDLVGTLDFKKYFEKGEVVKEIYDLEQDLKTYLETVNVDGNVVIAKKGTDAFLEAQTIITHCCEFAETNVEYIKLISK